MVKNGRIRLNLTLLQRKNSGNDTPCIYSIITLFKTKHIMINYESIYFTTTAFVRYYVLKKIRIIFQVIGVFHP